MEICFCGKYPYLCQEFFGGRARRPARFLTKPHVSGSHCGLFRSAPTPRSGFAAWALDRLVLETMRLREQPLRFAAARMRRTAKIRYRTLFAFLRRLLPRCRSALQPSRLYPKLRRLRPRGWQRGTETMRLRSNRVRPEPWGCGGLRYIARPPLAPSWCYSARKLICVSPAVCDFVKSRSARSHPGRRAEECPPRRALSSLRWLRAPLGGVGARSRGAEMKVRADAVSPETVSGRRCRRALRQGVCLENDGGQVLRGP